jgi:hypothetical protein
MRAPTDVDAVVHSFSTLLRSRPLISVPILTRAALMTPVS